MTEVKVRGKAGHEGRELVLTWANEPISVAEFRAERAVV